MQERSAADEHLCIIATNWKPSKVPPVCRDPLFRHVEPGILRERVPCALLPIECRRTLHENYAIRLWPRLLPPQVMPERILYQLQASSSPVIKPERAPFLAFLARSGAFPLIEI